MELIFSKKFQQQAKRIVENKPNLKRKINACLIDISASGRASDFYRKKLKGPLLGYEELAVGGDIRIIVRINRSADKCVLEEIGTHAQLGFG